MLRIFTIAGIVWRFGLDQLIPASVNSRCLRLWRWLFCWRRFSSPAAARLRQSLETLGPIFVKFGQFLSTRHDLLPPEYIAELEKLQEQVPPEKPDIIRAALADIYNAPHDTIFAEFDMQPVGSASVAQVHRARLVGGRADVAVKILRPGIRRKIKRDIEILRAFAALLEYTLRDGRLLRPRAVVAEFAGHLDEETDLMLEAANCAQIGRNFRAAVYWQMATTARGRPSRKVYSKSAANALNISMSRFIFRQPGRNIFTATSARPPTKRARCTCATDALPTGCISNSANIVSCGAL